MSLIKANGNQISTRSIFNDLFDLENFFGSDFFGRAEAQNIPAVNVKETDTQFEVQLAAPGFDKKDLKISIDNDVLNISAEKKEEKTEEDKEYKRREFNYSSFSRSFRLPKTVKEQDIKAEYKDGILMLNLPKAEAQKPSKKLINVE